MPISGLSGRVRIPRTLKIRLGYKQPGKNFPKDSDVFVGRVEDGVTKEILEAYGKGKIDDAEGETWNLGKSLRMLSYFEWDATSPQDERELVVELMNRSWSHSKLKCFGDGGDQPGTAHAADEDFAKEIQKATHKTPVRMDDGRFRVVCLGPQCPFWNSNIEKDKRATCHRELRLRARLLDPETNPEAPNYLKQLGWVEIASGSFNGMLDIQSGLQIMRSVAGRSAGIPFTLRRAPRTVLSDGKRLTKATLLVDYDHDEAVRFGYSDPKLSLVRPEVRRQLLAMKREQIELARLEVDYDSVKDIVPRLGEPRLGGPGRTDYPLTGPATGSGDGEIAGGPVTVPGPPTSAVADRDDVIDQAQEQAKEPELSPEELNRRLTQAERNELKTLTGGKPGDSASLAKLRELMAAAFAEFGDEPGDLASLRVKHAAWIRKTILAERVPA